MNNFDIETTFRKIDKHFVEELSSQERIKALKQFKRVYAEQMAKLAMEVEKRMKVQSNLDEINQKAVNEVKQIDEQLRKKMEKYNLNREKLQSSKLKEHKMIEQNWKRRLDEIVRKNRQKQKQAYRKAEKIRKEAQQFWIKKSETVNFREDGSRITQNNETYIGMNSNSRSLGRDRSSQTVYVNKKNMLLPSLTKTKIKRNQKDDTKLLNKSIDQRSLNEQIRIHKEKCIKTSKEHEQQNFQKIMGKLEKIQQTRKSVHERIQKETKQAKRLRELRQNPEMIAANKKKSLQEMERKMKSKGKPRNSKADLSNSQSGSKSNLNDSIYNRLEKSKRLKEAEFERREDVFEQKMKKIKNSKINRMVREAVNIIKHNALSNGNQ